MNKKILAVIPARMGSTRFHGKPLAQILNKPMIQWVYEAVKKTNLFYKIVVATDSEEIKKVVENFKGLAEMTSENHRSGLDRVIEIAEKYADYDIFVNIQGDEPLIHKETIEGVLNLFRKYSDCDIATSAVKFKKYEDYLDQNKVKVVLNKNSKALYFSRSAIPFYKNKKDFEKTPALKHQGLYAYKRNILLEIKNLEFANIEEFESLEQLRFLYNNLGIYASISKYDSIGVDTPEDLKIVEKLLAINGFEKLNH